MKTIQPYYIIVSDISYAVAHNTGPGDWDYVIDREFFYFFPGSNLASMARDKAERLCEEMNRQYA